MKAATVSIFRHLFASIAEEMGVSLSRSAYSPNIKERLDFSCALFLGDGRLLAQAAHIPVHLGAMPASVRAAIKVCTPFEPGDVVIVNDPYSGGTHLPDLTMITPAFPNSTEKAPDFFVASRAHHADIGGSSPGSMPMAQDIYQEGLIIPPCKLFTAGQRNDSLWRLILHNVRTPTEREGDLIAQLAANTTGLQRLEHMISSYGVDVCREEAEYLIRYAARLTRAAVDLIPNGMFTFVDYLDDDGQGSGPVPIRVKVTIDGQQMTLDFRGTAPAVVGNLNAVPAIVDSAAVYCLRCIALHLIGSELPMNEGAFEPITVLTEPGSLLNPRSPHAVSAGNVETSQRLVDVIFGAIAQALPNVVPAASQGTMNNLTFGSRIGEDPPSNARESQVGEDPSNRPFASPFAYYETVGGGIGAGHDRHGGDGMHAHMSNTRNTPVEALEFDYPVRVLEYRYREDSGGNGLHRGGNGLIRTIEFLMPVTATILSERRYTRPYGLMGGKPGAAGLNNLIRENETRKLPGKVTLELQRGDRLQVLTPGGGGWGSPDG